MHDACTGVLGLLVIQVDALPDERRLPGQVRVVGSGGRTRRHQRQTVAAVGTDRGDDHLRRSGHGRQGLRRRRVSGQKLPRLGRLPQRVADRLETVGRAAGQRDPRIAPSPGQVFGCQLADEAGCAVQDDVVFTRCSHGREATPSASGPSALSLRTCPAGNAGTPATAMGRSFVGQPRRPQTGQAPMPCECSTFSATRICSSRLALLADPEPPFARQVPGVNCRPPE